MERLIVVVVLVVAAVLFALILRRLTGPAKPAAARRWTVPAQLHRADFAALGASPVVVVVFSSATCDGCGDVWDRVAQLASPEVAVRNVVWQDERALHERYGVDAVPTTLVAGRDGAVHESFVGTVSSLELRAAVNSVRRQEQAG